MARQTRRRRDAKSKSRFRPRFSSAFGRAGSEEKEVQPRKVEKVNWSTVLALLAIFLFSLYIRTAWTLEPATTTILDDGFELTGGSDPYYHKRVVDYVVDNGEHLQRDPMLNYPYGANNNRPPLFDWSIAIIGLAISPFFESTEESVWWSMEVLPAIYGALIIFPVYAIGRAQFGKEAGLIGAFLIGVNSGHVSHSSLALADHDSYVILLGTTAFFFFMRALTVSNDRKWVSNWSDWEDIKKGILSFVETERLALGYAGLSGITITMIALSWKGFPYIMGIIAIYLGFQMLINAFRRVDSLTTASIGLVTMAMPVLLSYPYYHTMGFVATWWEAPAYILLGYVMLSVLMVTTRDQPWLLVIGSSVGMAAAIYLLLTYVFKELGFLLFSGQGYFVRTKLFNTIAEAQPPEFADFVFAFGPVSLWLAIFGIIWMAYQLFNQSIWKKDYLFVMIWALVSIYMAQSAVRFIFNATPVVSLISGWMTWLIIQWADFPSVIVTWKAFWGKRGDVFFWLALISIIAGGWLFFTVGILIGLVATIILLALVMVIGHMDAQGEDQYRFRDRLSGLRKAFEVRRPLIVMFVGLFIFLPNTFYGYDAGVPFEDKKDHDVAVYDFLSYDFLRPDEYMNDEKTNTSLYPAGVTGMYNKTNNQLWYMGNTGPSFPSNYWIEGLGWLSEQDTNLKPEDRPGFISWWDYGFWAIDIGEHPTVADNFQFGYQIAGNFIASQSEHEAMALLLYRLLEPEVDRDTGKFNAEIRNILLGHLSEDNITEFETIIMNPEDYIPKKADGSDQDVHKKNAAIRAGKPILMTIEKSQIADLMWEVEQATGHSIRYFAADTRLMPYSADNTGILYAPVTLADYDISNFFDVEAVLSDGRTVPFAEAIDIVTENPSIQVTDQTLVYKDKFLNSTFFRAFIGWSAPDIGRDISDGIPGIYGTIGQDQSLPPLFGWNMTHFKMVHSNSGLRILKYYDCATIYGTISTPNGDPVANANVTVLDENRVPHATVTTEADGTYSILVPAGNLTLAVSMGYPEADREKIFKTSNNILLTKENIIISEEQAMRQAPSDINLDLEVEAASISSRLYWDSDKDGEFGADEVAIPLITIEARNIRSGVINSVTTDSNGNYKFEGLAPGEYKVTAVIDGHHLDLKSYLGTAAVQAGQDVTVDDGLEPGAIWGKFTDEGLGSEVVTVSLYDHTNNSISENTFLSSSYHTSECISDYIDDMISFCFNNLLPGEYTLRMDSENVFTGWTNNTMVAEIDKGETRSFNGSLMPGFRLEGILSHNDNPIGNEQMTIRNIDGQYSDNVFTTEDGYFATVLPRGTYDLYTIHQTNQTTLAYLDLVDSETYAEPIDAEMSSGHMIEGILFGDLDGNGLFGPDAGEKGYGEAYVVFDSGSGSTSTTTSYDGRYEIIIPEGDYSAWSHASLAENQNLVALKSFQVNRNAEGIDLPAVIGQDALVILYEDHMDEILTLDGTVKFSSAAGEINFWVTRQITQIPLPLGDYQIEINKFGYTLDTMYYGPENEKVETDKLSLNNLQEILLEVERIPVDVSGRLVNDGEGIANADLSFAPKLNPWQYNLTFQTDSDGHFDISLPPEDYIYTFSYEDEEGSRYWVQDQMTLPLGTSTFDMGDVDTELTYRVSGVSELVDGTPKAGMVILRPVDDFDNITVLDSNTFEGYSSYLEAGDYYVTFQDGMSNKHFSFGGLLELDGPTVFNLELKDEGSIRGDVKSDADNSVINDRSVRIQFVSEEGVTFVEDTIEDEGLFGAGDEYGRLDLPYGTYDVIVEQDGYEKFTGTVEINGQNDYYGEINLIPKMVNITLEITYQNATGSIVPLTGVTVVFTATTGGNFAHVTDEDGRVIISDMIPKTYEIEIDETQNEGADQFKLSKQNMYVKAGKGDQLFMREAEWKVKVSGTIFYDRDFDGEADANELLPDSQLEIWSVDGSRIESSTTSEIDGSYQIYLETGAYKTWAYTTEGTSYVNVGALELGEAISLSPSLTRGVNYNINYLSEETLEPVDLGQVEIDGANFSFEIGVVDDGINIWMPAGEYSFNAEYQDLSGSDDYVYTLDKNINITDDMDGIDQTELMEKKLMRGIVVSLDTVAEEIPIDQAAIFTFSVTGTGHLNAIFEPTIDNIPQNWTAFFEPNKLSISNGTEIETVLSITPNEGVVPKVWEVFYVDISWSDGSNNEVDDISHPFAVTVTPIEQPEPDFEISEITWNPEVPSAGTEVTLTATITNLVNHSGSHYVPVVFYADGEAINLTTAVFDGSGNDVTVNATWTSTAGSHVLKVGIDPDNAIDEADSENNERAISVSVENAPEESTNSTLKMAALVVVGLVAGLAYVSYRSRR